MEKLVDSYQVLTPLCRVSLHHLLTTKSNLVTTKQCFGVTCCLITQGKSANFFHPEDGDGMFHCNIGILCIKLDGGISLSAYCWQDPVKATFLLRIFYVYFLGGEERESFVGLNIVVVKSVALCLHAQIYRHFGVTHCLHILETKPTFNGLHGSHHHSDRP